MRLSDNQKLELMAARRGVAGSGGVLMVGGFLLVWFTVPSTVPWWFGWLVLGAGVLALIFAAVLCFFPNFLCDVEAPRNKRAA